MKAFNKIGINSALIISGNDVDDKFIKVANNIQNLDVLHNGLNVYDIVKKDNLIILDEALKLVERLLWV